MITVFTATYNRESLLPRLYKSLVNQTCYDFEWLVVDDGSKDNTERLISEYKEKTEQFPIRYIKKTNGGKHTAVNLGVQNAGGEWFFMVDSDDCLADNAIEVLARRCSDIHDRHEICGITCLKVYDNGKEIGSKCNYKTIDTDYFTYRYSLGISGDRAECVRTSVMKEFPFPVFEGERYVPESVVWLPMSMKYKMRFTDDRIYITEYMLQGLTNQGRSLFMGSPIGSAYDCIVKFNCPKMSIKERLLNTVRYIERIGWLKNGKKAVPEIIAMPAAMKKYVAVANLILYFKPLLLPLKKVFRW